MKPHHWLSFPALLAFFLPPLVFPEMVFLGQSFYFLDLAWFHYPLRAYIAAQWQEGAWPLWNPYSWNGFPLLAESEAGALSLVNAVFLLPIATWQALNLLILVHVAIAGLSAYALARQVAVRRGGALLSALSYACGGYLMAQLLNLNIMIGSAWAPLIFALLLRAMERRRLRFAVLAGATFALQITSSHPQVPYYTLIALGVFASYGLLRRWQVERRRTWRALVECGVMLGLTFFLGLGLSAPQWLTALELLSLSRRAQGLAADAQLLLSMPPNSFLTLIFPRLFVFPAPNWRKTGVFDEFHFYLGLIPLVCAVLASLRRNELIVRVAFLLSMVTFVLALGRFTPLYAVVANLPLLSSFRIPARWLFLTAIAFIILIGKGADAFMDLLRDEARRPLLTRIMRYLTILYVALTLTVPVALLVRPPNREVLQLENDYSAERIATRAETAERLLPEAIGFTLGGGVSLAAAWMLAWRKRPRAFAAAAIAITFADLFFAGGSPAISPSFWEQGQPLATFVKQRDVFARIFSTGANLDVLARLGDAEPTGARVFASSGENDLPLGLQRIEDLLSGVSFEQYLRLTGTHWLVIAKNLPRVVNRHATIAQSVATQFSKVWETEQINVYAVPDPLPHAYLVYDVRAATSQVEALELLRDARFDPQRMAVVEAAPAALPHRDSPITPAAIAQYAATSLRVEANAASDGMLLLTDVQYPGWRAWVDGGERPIVRANYLFRGVMVSPGKHTIEFRFESFSFQIGLLIAATTIALALIGWGTSYWGAGHRQ